MTDHRRDNIMPAKMRECDGCHRIMRSDYLKIHMKKCKELNQNDDETEDDIVALDHLSREKRHPGGKVVVEIDFANMGVCACAQKQRASRWNNGKKFHLLVKRGQLVHLNLL